LDILFFTPSYYPRIGGVEKSVSMVSRELIRKGHRVTIITEKAGNLDPSFEEFSNQRIYRISKSNIPKTGMIRKWIWLLFHIRLIARHNIIHFHDFHVLIYWYLPFRFLFFFKKHYITFHGYEGYPLKNKFIKLRKLCENLTRGNICIGSWIEKWYGTKADFISYGAADPLTEQYSNTNSRNILFIGRLEEDTGILIYIEALRIFKKDAKTNFLFQICGDGTLKENIISKLTEYNIPFEFFGFKKDISPFIQTARVILASTYLTIMEAISFRKPLIACYGNDLKKDYLESFPDQKKMFSCAANPDEINDLLKSAFNDDNQYLPSKENASEFGKNHTWYKIAEIYTSLYKI
jgi:L-malate glycosyltransferase